MGESRIISGLSALVRGKPATVKIPGVGEIAADRIPAIDSAAESYMAKIGRPGEHVITDYPAHDPDFGRRIASAYDAMKHDPSDPAVRRSYEALLDETMDQYRALKDSGIDFKFLKDGMSDPYARSPSLGYMDLRDNGRLWVFPTEQGYGTGADISDNPLLKRVGKVGDLTNATANDAFRVVHDAYGHFGPGNPFFRAPGEDRAWMNHSRMFSDDALPAMTSETRGQNSWVNYGPYAEANKTASGGDTHCADQKAGIMPEWTWKEMTGKASGGLAHYGEGGTARISRKDAQAALDYANSLDPLEGAFEKQDRIKDRFGLSLDQMIPTSHMVGESGMPVEKRDLQIPFMGDHYDSGIPLPAPTADVAEGAAEMVLPQSVGDLALNAALGPTGKVVGKVGRGALAALGAYSNSTDPANAMWLGQKARGAPLSMLERAKGLLRDAESSADPRFKDFTRFSTDAADRRMRDLDAIRRETGWLYGPDKKWRWEIEDPFSPAPNLELGGIGYIGRMDNVVEHPELFDNYPDLERLKLRFEPQPNSNVRGHYQGPPSSADEHVFLQATGDQGQETLLHELQHAVQAREGFTPGQNTMSAGAEGAETLNKGIAGASYMGASDPVARRVIDQGNAIKSGIGGLSPAQRSDYDFGLYKRDLGEAEARATGARRGWTMDDRMERPFSQTYDVHPNRLIVPSRPYAGNFDPMQLLLDDIKSGREGSNPSWLVSGRGYAKGGLAHDQERMRDLDHMSYGDEMDSRDRYYEPGWSDTLATRPMGGQGHNPHIDFSDLPHFGLGGEVDSDRGLSGQSDAMGAMDRGSGVDWSGIWNGDAYNQAMNDIGNTWGNSGWVDNATRDAISNGGGGGYSGFGQQGPSNISEGDWPGFGSAAAGQGQSSQPDSVGSALGNVGPASFGLDAGLGAVPSATAPQNQAQEDTPARSYSMPGTQADLGSLAAASDPLGNYSFAKDDGLQRSAEEPSEPNASRVGFKSGAEDPLSGMTWGNGTPPADSGTWTSGISPQGMRNVAGLLAGEVDERGVRQDMRRFGTDYQTAYDAEARPIVEGIFNRAATLQTSPQNVMNQRGQYSSVLGTWGDGKYPGNVAGMPTTPGSTQAAGDVLADIAAGDKQFANSWNYANPDATDAGWVDKMIAQPDSVRIGSAPYSHVVGNVDRRNVADYALAGGDLFGSPVSDAVDSAPLGSIQTRPDLATIDPTPGVLAGLGYENPATNYSMGVTRRAPALTTANEKGYFEPSAQGWLSGEPNGAVNTNSFGIMAGPTSFTGSQTAAPQGVGSAPDDGRNDIVVHAMPQQQLASTEMPVSPMQASPEEMKKAGDWTERGIKTGVRAALGPIGALDGLLSVAGLSPLDKLTSFARQHPGDPSQLASMQGDWGNNRGGSGYSSVGFSQSPAAPQQSAPAAPASPAALSGSQFTPSFSRQYVGLQGDPGTYAERGQQSMFLRRGGLACVRKS